MSTSDTSFKATRAIGLFRRDNKATTICKRSAYFRRRKGGVCSTQQQPIHNWANIRWTTSTGDCTQWCSAWLHSTDTRGRGRRQRRRRSNNVTNDLIIVSAEEACERASHKQEQMLNQIEELRATVRQKDEYLTAKRHEIDLVNQSQAHAFIIRFSSQL